MRLLSYNIHKGIGNDRRYDLERTLRVLENEKPDLICLQEVDQHVRRSRYHNQPHLLAESLRAADYLYQLNVPRHEGGYGNLVLSRWPIVLKNQMSLRLNWRKPRGAQLLVVQTPEGPLHLVNWHLGLWERERRWQANYLLQHQLFLQSSHLPTLIVGDFNDWRNTLDRLIFTSHAFIQATSPLKLFRSFPSFMTLTSLDKLFYRGTVAIEEARMVRTPLTRRASDHLPLVVDFRLTATAAT